MLNLSENIHNQHSSRQESRRARRVGGAAVAAGALAAGLVAGCSSDAHIGPQHASGVLDCRTMVNQAGKRVSIKSGNLARALVFDGQEQARIFGGEITVLTGAKPRGKGGGQQTQPGVPPATTTRTVWFAEDFRGGNDALFAAGDGQLPRDWATQKSRFRPQNPDTVFYSSPPSDNSGNTGGTVEMATSPAITFDIVTVQCDDFDRNKDRVMHIPVPKEGTMEEGLGHPGQRGRLALSNALRNSVFQPTAYEEPRNP